MATQYALTLDLHKPQQNHLLAALHTEIITRLGPHLKFEHVSRGRVLLDPGIKMHHVYFPTDSIISLVSVMYDGHSSEYSMVGNEGMLGVPVFMGGESTSSRAVVISAGGVFSLSREILKKEFERHGALMVMLLHYTQALITQVAQNAVCNRHHGVDQQLCRWLLMSLDRVPGNRLLMTQELIASMLGVRREGISEAAGRLQKQGVIMYRRGMIEVLDRKKLKSQCCECYTVVKKECDRLLNFTLKSQIDRTVHLHSTKNL
jgi:CRP-like cAMP-binding protein